MLAAQSSICQKVPSPYASRGCPSAVRQNLNRRAVKVAAKTLTIAEPVTEATFPELVLKSDVPVLIDFWAPWCGPCRMIAPIIDEIASEYQGKMRCYKLNTDESPKIAAEYGVRSIPTVLILKDGKKLETIIGALPKQAIVKSVDKYL